MAKQVATVPRHYWDSCVFLHYLAETPEHVDVIEALLEQASEGRAEIVTSHLTVAEVAFIREEPNCGVREADLTPELRAKVDALWLPPSPVRMVEVGELVVYEARDLIRMALARSGGGLRAHDAIHLASARRMSALSVLTYDEKLTTKGKSLGMNVRAPEMPERAPSAKEPESPLFEDQANE